ncbi:hypothetical protein Lal_00043018 [Lupinus albus]|nr:hypothetical protein Lal_00043018 [Lupinus albus]
MWWDGKRDPKVGGGVGRIREVAKNRTPILTKEMVDSEINEKETKWQPKVTAIVESKDLDSIPLATLFGKLQEHEMELGRLTMHDDSDRKKKNITLKATTSKSKEEKDDDESDSDLDDETMNLLVRKFSKFIKKKSSHNVIKLTTTSSSK